MITTLDRLGRSTQIMLAFAEALPGSGAVTVMAALAQVEMDNNRESISDLVSK